MKQISGAALANKYRRSYKQLFTIAYSITGNECIAESILLDTLSTCPQRRVLSELKRRSIEAAEVNCSAEFLETEELFSETALVRRVILLYYGCNLKIREIAAITECDTLSVKRMLKRAHTVPNIKELCAAELTEGRCAPDIATFKRALDSRIEHLSNEEFSRISRIDIFRLIIYIIIFLITAGLIWLCAVFVNYYVLAAGGLQNA